jgi:flagellar basal-body rod protein FlgF
MDAIVSGLGTAASAMDAQSERLAVLANNLANVAAAGFKTEHLSFVQLLTSPRAVGSVPPTDPAAPLTTQTQSETRTDFSPGAMRDTGNALDVAIDGPGFFVIGSATEPKLTRAGNFVRGRDGALTTSDGTPVLDTRRRPIKLPDRGTLEVDDSGTISADGETVATMWVTEVPRRDALIRDGGTRFIPPVGSDLPNAKNPGVRQGVLEQSNVNPVLTLVEMVDALRVYEASQRAAKGVDETLSRAVNDVPRT